MKERCGWCESSPTMREYHDTEWGFPTADDRRLFEKINLEGFQSGLSWKTVLDKRDDFRRVFHGFDPEIVARMKERDVVRLLGDASIIRHRGKIESTINNARRCLELIEEKGSLAAHIWGFEPPRRPVAPTVAEVSTFVTSAESVALSKDLKKRGWSFVGPTTMYAFMQSMGLVNDHHAGCFVHEAAEKARKRIRIG
ncbi:MAG: DNA-3-methyladenine glycosylase I [Ilumatobacteraceae bacterium]